jgi:hypothetical protein
LDDAGGAERRAARQRRQEQSSSEILQTFLAYKLDHAAEKMELGIAIGDQVLLRHEPDNQWDPNAIKVFWNEQWIGYIPKDMAALIAREVPEAGIGLDAVVTGLTTTSLRDAFRLQLSIPIPRASRRLRELGVSSAFAWDFDRNSGTDKMRLVISCTETAFRELQELLQGSFDVSKCGYSYYPSQDGRHYPWYLSLTDANGRAPEKPDEVERLIRSHFGVASENSREKERQERLQKLEEKQEEINKRLETSRAEERRLRREFDLNKTSWERRAEKAMAKGEEAIELAQNVEEEIQKQLDLKDQELQMVLAENQSLEDQVEQITNERDALQLQLAYPQMASGSGATGELGFTAWSHAADEASETAMAERLFNSLRALAGRGRFKPRECLQLVSEDLCPGNLLVLESGWNSADQARGFEHGDRLFELLWHLATSFHSQKLAGTPDLVAAQVFGANSYAARESQTIEKNRDARRERTFTYHGKSVEMWQHLKIGFKDSENRTLRVHFCWDGDLNKVVIGHCGRHLYNPNH